MIIGGWCMAEEHGFISRPRKLSKEYLESKVGRAIDSGVDARPMAMVTKMLPEITNESTLRGGPVIPVGCAADGNGHKKRGPEHGKFSYHVRRGKVPKGERVRPEEMTTHKNHLRSRLPHRESFCDAGLITWGRTAKGHGRHMEPRAISQIAKGVLL